MEYKCSLCDYSSDTKRNVIRHINKKIKCSSGLHSIIEIKNKLRCEFCGKSVTTKSHLTQHLKVCKAKKEKLVVTENEILKDKNKKLEELCQLNSNHENKNKEIIKKLEDTVEQLVKMIDIKVLGNVSVETIRKESRKKYLNFNDDNRCVHCKHYGSVQVCHIKPISEFSKLSTVEEINDLSNLIGLCPNCHIDLDKHKKFEITRTATLHNLIIKKLESNV